MNNETEIDKITKLANCRNKINFTLKKNYLKKLFKKIKQRLCKL